jgi:putative ABC transport system ATP-binding protein
MATESASSSSPAAFSASAGGSQALIRPLRDQKGLLHRRGGDPRPAGHSRRSPARRVRRDGRTVRLRQDDAALDPRTPRHATDGEYTLAGEPVAQLTPSQRARIRNRQIGFIFQAFNLIGDLTVYENVELPLTYRGMSAAERKQRVTDALERVGMSHRMKHYPAQLSGGQQQRVAVARAVAGDPLILLADEPTGNLDSTNGEAVMELLRELHRGGATICMVTHDPRYAAHADRSIHLFDGRVVEEQRRTEKVGA